MCTGAALAVFFLLRQSLGTPKGSAADDVPGDLEDVVAETW